MARAGLLGGNFKGKDDEVNAMSDTEVLVCAGVGTVLLLLVCAGV